MPTPEEVREALQAAEDEELGLRGAAVEAMADRILRALYFSDDAKDLYGKVDEAMRVAGELYGGDK